MNKPPAMAAGKPRRAADHGTAPAVLQVLPRLVSGGVERGCIDVAAALANAGRRGAVASAGGPMVRELERAGVEHFTLPLASKNAWTMWRNAGRVAGLARTLGVGLIHARSRAPAHSARLAARRLGLPFVTTFHGTYNFRGGPKRFYNSVMVSGDRVIAISEFIGEHIRANYAVEPERVVVIPRGIDLDVFDPHAVPAPRIIQLSQRWRLPDGAPVVMLPGRLTRWKGQTIFLDAIARLETEVCAVLVGGHEGREDFRAELEERARRLGIAGRVRFAGHCDDMPAALMLADVVVSASTDPEAFGRVPVEAQAMGRPVVATDHGGARETVLEGATGWLVPPGDAGALASGIERALALDPESRDALAERAGAHARSKYGKALMCARTLALYDEVLAEAGAG